MAEPIAYVRQASLIVSEYFAFKQVYVDDSDLGNAVTWDLGPTEHFQPSFDSTHAYRSR
ncbi:hypothetical protein M378DRAFT_166749 [Amanita muscaria Koide BX008]|uniref:Uncharacterized protein n=1 Tax=Amanita muscaria (strain Koide BX008) TaxID=946122 RepID=A0A0C2SEY9_AMAMK|nr:hypothetical protein M378DRAFT_166749 [Amanita muscaria Koide BX008]